MTIKQTKNDKSKYFCGITVIILVGFVSLLISGCASIEHELEKSYYMGKWWKIIENDPAGKSGYKRLQNEMAVSPIVEEFVTTKGLPDYICVIEDFDDYYLELAYLQEKKVYRLAPFFPSSSRHKIASRDLVDEQKFPAAEFMVKALEETAVAKSELGERGKGPKEIKRILPQAADYKEYGNKYAIVIGISDYKELKPESNEPDKTRLFDLQYGNDDARDFIEFLKNKEKSGGDWLIYSFIDQKAKKEDIRRKLDDVLTLSRPIDLIYIFFSGHGRSSPYDPGEIYLLTYDFKYEDYYDGIPYSWLRSKIEESPAEHIILFVDACRSGTIGFARGGANRPDARFMGQLSITIPNKVIFTSGRGTQQAFESNELRNGVFTYFLVQGLNGKAPDVDHDEFVDLSELRDYVEEKVKSYTASTKKMKMQIPRLWERKGLIADDFPVAIRY